LSKYTDFETKTETEFVVPLAYGAFVLGDLFFDLDEPLEFKLKPGEFHAVSDTIPFTAPSFTPLAEDIRLVFRAGNVLPFRVDLELIPIDTMNFNHTGDVLFSTVVEAAYFDEVNDVIIPVTSEHSLNIGLALQEKLNKTNGLILDLKFVWPHDTVNVSIIDQLFAFDLKVFVEVDL
jgi:hypothetical protein